jgi:hypothetical protein
MVNVGDRIRLSSGKGPDREGAVTVVTGSMVRMRWPSGEETTVVPGTGETHRARLVGGSGAGREARAGGGHDDDGRQAFVALDQGCRRYSSSCGPRRTALQVPVESGEERAVLTTPSCVPRGTPNGT